MNNLILHKLIENGFQEYIPDLDSLYPQSLQIDSAGKISWKHINEIEFPEIPNYLPQIKTMEKTTMDMFSVISEQQKRIDELTDKLNAIIKFLK